MAILQFIIGLLIGLATTVVVTVIYKKGLSKQSKELAAERIKAKEEAKQLIVDAELQGENRKRELLLQTKEEVHLTKTDLEKSAREQRQELQRDRNRLNQKEENYERKVNNLERKEEALQMRIEEIDHQQNLLSEKENKIIAEMERISGLSISEARDQVLDEARVEYRHDMAIMLRQMEEETNEIAEREAREIIVNSIQRYASDYVSESTVSVVDLPNEEMKGRIIGREGRNIRTLENLTGVDLIIDDTPEAVIISSFNPVRREIARLTLERLVFDGRIHPSRIEESVAKANKEVEQSIKEAGEEAVFETGVVGLHPEIIRLLGRMKYRTSYGQNVLKHSIEVCWLTGAMAAELGLDVMLAKRAGLLHDIGKATDFELEGTHVQIGSEIAKKYNEGPVVINAIESHHGDKEATDLIANLVAAADAISAARPGARRENVESYIKRIESLEEIANSFDGVDKTYAVQAGREIRVMVKPDQVTDDEMILKAHEISKKIENELTYPGMIKVQMIRESRVSDYAK
ncbi:MAG: ribonuclease Y [Clostridiaceae bacterium]|nr:ribonuclease Y [Bacillota bacterium]NLN51288.1 ribonuclease Y [Clostridiaceae bacterium]